jgi:RNA recognition motif-containing protein
MKTIYVGNLSRNTTENTLKSLFEQYGTVASVKIVIDRMTGEPRGFAFVDMEDADAADAAINALNGKEVDGQRLRINEARPREERPANRGRSFGGNRGGDFRGGRGGNRSSNDDRGGFRSRY